MRFYCYDQISRNVMTKLVVTYIICLIFPNSGTTEVSRTRVQDLDLDLDLFDFSNICHKDWSKKLFCFIVGPFLQQIYIITFLAIMNLELIESLFKYQRYFKK